MNPTIVFHEIVAIRLGPIRNFVGGTDPFSNRDLMLKDRDGNSVSIGLFGKIVDAKSTLSVTVDDGVSTVQNDPIEEDGPRDPDYNPGAEREHYERAAEEKRKLR